MNQSHADVSNDLRFVVGLTAISGFVVVLMSLVSTVAPLVMAHPGAGDSAQKVAAYLIEQRGSLLTGMFLLGLGWGGFLLVFLSGLYKLLRPSEGGSGVLCLVGFGAGVALAAMLAMLAAIFATAVIRIAADDPNSARSLYLEGFIVGNFSGIPTCVNAAAFSAVILRSNALPRGIGWLGMAAAVIHIVAAGSLAADGPLSPTGMVPQAAPVIYILWILAISIALARSISKASTKVLNTTASR